MAEEITLKIIFDHITAMEQRLTGRIDRVEKTVVQVEARLLAQIDAIDDRLDLIEIETLPSRVKSLETAVLG